MSTHFKKANLALVLILIISLLVPSSVNAAPKDSDPYRASFTKKSPTNQVSGLATTGVKLQWNAVNDVFQYRYCYYSYDISNNVCDIADKATWKSSGTSTSVTLPTLTTGKTYHWQVFAKLEDNSVVYADGSLSASWSFTIGQTTVGAGTYDNTHSNWKYYGKWATLTGTGPYQSTYKETRDIPDYATFTFTGVRVRLYYTQKPSRGTMYIYLDSSTTPIELDQSGDLTYQQWWMSDILTSGTHTIKFVYVSGGYVDIDAIQVFSQADLVAPAQITPLTAVSGTTTGTVKLNWTAVGDDLKTGTAHSYLVRYSLDPIDDTNWDTATVVTKNIPTPKAANQAETMTIGELTPGETYYFAIRAQDEQSNIGPLSPSASAVAYRPPPLNPGSYDDTNVSWLYTGNWIASNPTGAANGTIHYTNTVGNYVDLRFNGAWFVLTFTKNTNRGLIEVYVDDMTTPVDTIDASNPTVLYQQKYTSDILTGPNPHTVRLKYAGGGTVIDIDAIQIFDVPVGPGNYDDADTHWLYTGTWTAYSASGAANGTIHYTSTVGNYAELRFNGVWFALTFTRNTNRGEIEVYVDDMTTPIDTIDAGYSKALYQQTYTSPVLSDPAEVHTVRVVHAGGGTNIDIDAIRIFDTLPPDPSTYSFNKNAPADNANVSNDGSLQLFWDDASIDSTDRYEYCVDEVDNGQCDTVWITTNSLSSGPGDVATAAGHTYYWQVRTQNSKSAADAGAWWSFTVRAGAGAGTYDDTDSHWVYTGNWTASKPTLAANGTIHYTNSAGAYAELQFSGTQFTLLFTKNTNRGLIDVYVDDMTTPVDTIDANNPTVLYQQTWTSLPYADKNHTVRFVNAGAAGTYIDIDAIEITITP